MILYNVTISIDENVHDEWLNWMKTVHIPDVMKTGMFVDNKICRIHGEEEGGKAYSIQYLAESWDHYNRYQEEFAQALQKDHLDRYSGKFGAFRTILEVVHHQTAEGVR